MRLPHSSCTCICIKRLASTPHPLPRLYVPSRAQAVGAAPGVPAGSLGCVYRVCTAGSPRVCAGPTLLACFFFCHSSNLPVCCPLVRSCASGQSCTAGCSALPRPPLPPPSTPLLCTPARTQAVVGAEHGVPAGPVRCGLHICHPCAARSGCGGTSLQSCHSGGDSHGFLARCPLVRLSPRIGQFCTAGPYLHCLGLLFPPPSIPLICTLTCAGCCGS